MPYSFTINHREHTDVSPDETYTRLRERFLDVSDLIPVLESITRISSEDVSPSKTITRHEWKVGDDLFPDVLREIVRPGIIRWDGTETWHHSNRDVHYKFAHFLNTNFVEVEGHFKVRPDKRHKNKSSIDVSIGLIIHYERIHDVVPQMPNGLVRVVMPFARIIITRIIKKNLAALPDAVDQLLRQD